MLFQLPNIKAVFTVVQNSKSAGPTPAGQILFPCQFKSYELNLLAGRRPFFQCSIQIIFTELVNPLPSRRLLLEEVQQGKVRDNRMSRIRMSVRTAKYTCQNE